MLEWRPTISTECMQQRARLLAKAREYFAERDVMEVETPLLGLHAVTDPNIQSIETSDSAGKRYLQTSPEYSMKRLLAAGAGDIYQICKSFRAQESGNFHNPEFTLVEWYRHDFSLQQMMQETVEFISGLLSGTDRDIDVAYLDYNEATRQKFGATMQEMRGPQLEKLATDHGLVNPCTLSNEQVSDFVFSSLVVPEFSRNKLTIVYDYPASQASLAKLSVDNPQIAQRFEVFYGGHELANGFVELTDAKDQLSRFNQDQQKRSQRGLPQVEIDRRLIAALEYGLPRCAGVAVGFDRIVMFVCAATSIKEVISFDWDSA